MSENEIRKILDDFYNSDKCKILEENLKAGCPDLQEMEKRLEEDLKNIPNDPFTI